jgi:hypothetical protein
LVPERGIFESGKDAVPGELVERHTAPAGGSLDHGARTEDGIGLLVQERGEDLRQRLGRVLAIAMEHHHDVEPVLDGQVVPRFLVAAVAEVVACLIRVIGRSDCCW